MRGLILCLILLYPSAVFADVVRFAVYNVGLSRKGPGILFRDIVERRTPDISGIAAVIQKLQPDVLLVMDFDHDFGQRAAMAFRDLLSDGAAGVDYPYIFSPNQNVGVQSGHDLNGNGKTNEAADALGYGRFRGDGGMILFSRFQIDTDAAQDFSSALWADFDWAVLPKNPDETPFPTVAAQAVMRLSSKAHWDVPIILPDGRRIHVLANHSSPPVFDGPEDANGLRNHDEAAFWLHYLAGGKATEDFVIMAGLNADPRDGDGAHEVVRNLTQSIYLQDPLPRSVGSAQADQGGVNTTHQSPAEFDTVDWRDDSAGNLRVEYVLPSAGLTILDSGVFWPASDDPDAALIELAETSHRLVWVDVE